MNKTLDSSDLGKMNLARRTVLQYSYVLLLVQSVSITKEDDK